MRDRPWNVYLLRCADGSLYCGATNDVTRRLAAHARGRVKYTRGRLPVELAHLEGAADKSDALRREAAWKRLSRAQKLARLVPPPAPAYALPAPSAPPGHDAFPGRAAPAGAEVSCAPAANSVSARDAENRRARARAPGRRLR